MINPLGVLLFALDSKLKKRVIAISQFIKAIIPTQEHINIGNG